MKRCGLMLALLVALAVFITATPSWATTTTNTGNVVQGQWYWGTHSWTTQTSGRNIWFTKTDGPEIRLEWYKCSDRTKHGSPVHFENADPTGRYELASNMAAGTTFCLAVYSLGNNPTDTYTGTLEYDIY